MSFLKAQSTQLNPRSFKEAGPSRLGPNIFPTEEPATPVASERSHGPHGALLQLHRTTTRLSLVWSRSPGCGWFPGGRVVSRCRPVTDGKGQLSRDTSGKPETGSNLETGTGSLQGKRLPKGVSDFQAKEPDTPPKETSSQKVQSTVDLACQVWQDK